MTLEQALHEWADAHRLTDAESEMVRERVLSSNRAEPDVEWLWDLLKPVTGLLDGPHRLHDTLQRSYARLA